MHRSYTGTRCVCGIWFGSFDEYHQHCKIYDYEARRRRRITNAKPGCWKDACPSMIWICSSLCSKLWTTFTHKGGKVCS